MFHCVVLRSSWKCPHILHLWRHLLSNMDQARHKTVKLCFWTDSHSSVPLFSLWVFVHLSRLFYHCVSSNTVIHSCVLSLQAVHLQIHLALAIISRDCEPSLDWLGVVLMGASSVNECNPLQPFSRGLSDPIHGIATKCEPRGCAGQSVRSSRINDHRLRFSQCLTPHTYKTMRDKRQSQNQIW